MDKNMPPGTRINGIAVVIDEFSTNATKPEQPAAKPNHYTTVYTFDTVDDAKRYQAKLYKQTGKFGMRFTMLSRNGNVLTVMDMEQMTLAERREVYERIAQ